MLLQLRNIHFQYPNAPTLFDNLNLEIETGKIYCLLGESGSGKSTLLHLIYGLLDWQQGQIHFQNTPVLGPKYQLVPGVAQMKLVAQKSDLMPYATVAENIGSLLSNIHLENKNKKIQELLHLVGLQEFANTLPKYLSGGQLQRVALAKALSQKPNLLLLDEAFSALDDSRKHQLRDALITYAKSHQMTIIACTHQLQDWLAWSDEIIIMKKGEIIEKTSPIQLFQTPKTLYSAQLLGEVNHFTPEQQQLLRLPSEFVYPNQLVTDVFGFEVEIINSQFAGFYYRNTATWQNKIIVFYSSKLVAGKQNLSYQALAISTPRMK